MSRGFDRKTVKLSVLSLVYVIDCISAKVHNSESILSADISLVHITLCVSLWQVGVFDGLLCNKK